MTTARRPAVLVVDSHLEENGATRVVLQLVEQWRNAGTRVVLFAVQRPGRGMRPATVPPGIRPIYPMAAREPGRRWALLAGLVRVLQLARGADVVVAGRELGLGLVVARAVTWVRRIPFAVLVQSDPGEALAHHETPKLRPVSRWALRSADRLLCVSPGLVPAVEALGVEGRRIAVTQNGVDVAAIDAAATQSVADLPGGSGPLLVAVGRLTRAKGFDVLIRAHARVQASGIPHRLVILGEGPDRASLEQLVEELGVSATVHLPGFEPNPLAVMARADLFCLPSRWEGSPLTLAEAMVVGTPVVAADCVAGPRQLLHDGAYGDLVPVGDVTALADAIDRHLRRPERLREAVALGGKWARENLEISRTAARALDVLRDTARAPL